MQDPHITFLLSLLLLLLVAASTTTPSPAPAPLLGGWTRIENLTDPHVVEIAQFAVGKHNNQTGAHLDLVKIVKGEQQVVAGMNYRLVIKAKDGGAERDYLAKVYERPWENFRKLIYFKPLHKNGGV